MLNFNGKLREVRHRRIRKKVKSKKSECPRLSVYRSLKNIYIQVVDDEYSHTLFSFSTLNKEIKDKLKYCGNISAANLLGEVAAQKLKSKGITKVVFDRGGCFYHGRIKAVADGLRKGGILF